MCQPWVNHSRKKIMAQPSPNRGKSSPSSVFNNSCQVETGTDYLAGVNLHLALPKIIMLVIHNYLLGIYAQSPLGAKWKIIKSLSWNSLMEMLPVLVNQSPLYIKIAATDLLNDILRSSFQFSRSIVSDSLRPHELQHARPPCPSPTPRVHSDSHPSSRWCHPAISYSVVPFSSCPQSLPASESFPMT